MFINLFFLQDDLLDSLLLEHLYLVEATLIKVVIIVSDRTQVVRMLGGNTY